MNYPKIAQRYVSLAGISTQDADTLTFSFASAAPVERVWGTEILEISTAAMNLERFSAGVIPFLWNHDEEQILGKAIGAWITNGKAYAKIRWADTAFAREKRSLVEQGILTGISFRYQVQKVVQGKDRKMTITRYEPLELSLVPIPADFDVGIGRSRFQVSTPTRGQTTMTELDERERILSIQGYGERLGLRGLASQLIENGTPLDAAKAAFLEHTTGNVQPVGGFVSENSLLGLDKKQQQSYSLSRAILAAASGTWEGAGLERDCHHTLASRMKEPVKGVLVPVADLLFPASRSTGQRNYLVGTPAAGGRLVATELLSESFIDTLRNRTQVLRLGARLMTGLVGNVDIPRRTGSSQTYWIAENEDIALSTGSFDLVSLRPKTLGALTKISRLLLLQGTPDAEQLVRDDLAAIMAIELDRAAIAGTGVGNQPTGIINTAGINSIGLGANGAALTWGDVVRMETELAVDNADESGLGYLTNAQVRGKLKTTEKASNTAEFIWTDMPSEPGMGMLNGYRAGVSQNIPGNLTKGTGTNLSAVIFANWQDLMIGQWGVMEVVANQFGDSDFPKGRISVRAMLTVDINVRQPSSFCLVSDAVTT
jgi:HK97 family phage major capsid protein